MIDLEKLRSQLDYDPLTGTFVWKVAKQGGKPVGTVAGILDPSTGYIRIGFEKALHYGHRLAWAYVHGHIGRSVFIKQLNDNRADIRLENLVIGKRSTKKG